MAFEDSKSQPSPPPPHARPLLTPIRSRPGPGIKDVFRTVIFALSMTGTTIGVFLIQVFIALPLRFIPLAATHRLSRETMRIAREAFGISMAAMSAPGSLGPTSFILTADESVDLGKVVERNEKGEVIGLRLNKNSRLCIVLAPFLRWVPIAGPGYRLFDFAFVGKGWPIQKSPIGKAIQKALKDDSPFAMMLFPEGTLFASDTQPTSDAFARKAGVVRRRSTCFGVRPDFLHGGQPFMRNVLQPRSTGLLFCLRTLLSQAPDATLYDITIGYPGVPARGYAEDYYTLASTFGRGVPPPAVHLHLRSVDLEGVSSIHPQNFTGKSSKQIDNDLTVEERAEFQEWTRKRWMEKDDLMDYFYQHGKFPDENGPVTLPVGVRGWGDAMRLVALVVAVMCAWLAVKAVW
ncbi:hypothetical protein P7C70_g9080, partial [Phenoliferia sp. Uapishka_3]